MYDKKMAIFYILEILKEYSDRNHLLKQKDIIDKLHNIYMIDIERKTIASTLDILSELGYDIYKGPGGVCLDEREFDETEIKFLIDAIYSSKIISGEQAKDISKKLYSFLSRYEQKDYSYIHKSTEITRTTNKEFFFNIDIISEAIRSNKKITFNYLTYDNKGKLIERGNKHLYKVSPYYLINNFGKYYLICNSNHYKDHSNYRVDYMCNIKLTDENIDPIDNIVSLGKNFNINKHINEHIYMFGGNVITTKIKIINDWAVTYIYDWFGKNASLTNENNELFAYIKSDDRAFYFWLLQYQEHFKVIEPKYMVDKIKDTLNKSIELYN